MKLPLNYAMLKAFTKVDIASVDQIIEMLKPEYGGHRSLEKDAMTEAIMTAESNGLLEEVGYELDEKNNLQVYYRANEDQKAEIERYLP